MANNGMGVGQKRLAIENFLRENPTGNYKDFPGKDSISNVYFSIIKKGLKKMPRNKVNVSQDQVEQLMKDNPMISSGELAETLKCPRSWVKNLMDNMGYRQVRAEGHNQYRWVKNDSKSVSLMKSITTNPDFAMLETLETLESLVDRAINGHNDKSTLKNLRREIGAKIMEIESNSK